MPAFFSDPTFWVGVAFVGFIAILLYAQVPKRVTDALDARAADISAELDEAARLREEAQALLASYQRKQQEAEKEAEEIIERAKEEADRLRAEAEVAFKEQIERRTRLTEQKIAQAEVQAIQDVRRISADTAVGAARRVIQETVDQSAAKKLVDRSISGLQGRLN